MTTHYRFPLPPVPSGTTAAPVGPIFESTRKAMHMVPNMYTYMAHAPALLQTYMDGYQRFRAESGFTPAEQEVVFLAISRENGCEYCMAAHSTVADLMSKVPRDVTDAIRDDRTVPDARLGALAAFTRHMVETRGRPSEAMARTFLATGYTDTQVLYIILAVGVKTISNYSNHICETPIDAAFKVREWRLFKAAQSLVDAIRK